MRVRTSKVRTLLRASSLDSLQKVIHYADPESKNTYQYVDSELCTSKLLNKMLNPTVFLFPQNDGV